MPTALMRGKLTTISLILPAFLGLAVFLIVPLAELISKSFLDPRGALVFYQRIVAVPSYAEILLRTLAFSAVTAVICLFLGYIVAYKLTKSGPIGRAVILICVLLPFWTNLLVRSYGWIVLLNPRGIINNALLYLGLIKSPLEMIYNEQGVLIGLTQIMLPYMILPLYAIMTRMDPRVTQASRSLGASPIYTFVKVYFPLTSPGVMAGLLLVFTLSLGFFVIPALLGGAKGTMFAQLIEFNINETLNWGMASALSASLLLTTLLLYWVGDRWFNLGSIWGIQR
jgi:ABC-type spermidine/putrescine transport system permease subunit I